ncbi:MAG TPA: DUF5916 domain-containing protein [Prolixibacteraceae bacterium]|jgi:hypothetical protein
MNKFVISGMLILGLLPSIYAQAPEKKLYTATRIASSPVINGILDEVVWQSGDWMDDFTQNEPYSGRPASQRTEFNILFDDNFLYVAIKAYDTSPDSIVSRLTRRDDTDGELVGIILDSFHDLRTGFLFAVSSAGVKYDHMITNDGANEDESWDPNWWVQTSINKEGWVAEMKIPFSQVRFDKNSGALWGLEVGRNLYRKNETSFWQHIPKDAPGQVHLYGELKGLEQIKPRKIFDVTPYAVAKTETFKADPENPFQAKGHSAQINAGLDAKIGVTNNMTMDLTINPDFGQVEADPSEVNLSAYETFFREKRPFFIEGNNITNFGLGIGDGDVGNDNLFYSRRIGRRPQVSPNLKDGSYADVPIQSAILGAAKLTGKTKNGLSVGFINAITNEEIADIDTIGGRIQKTVEPFTNYFIGRVQKDIHDGKTLIGGIFTSTNRILNDDTRDFLHKSAYTGGIDFTQYFKNKSWMLNFNNAFSLVQGSKSAIENTQKSSARYFQRPDRNYAILDTNRTSLAGSGGRLQILKLNGNWNYMFATIWKSPQFETNDVGFLREADQVLSVVWGQYNQFEPKGIYRKYNVNAGVYQVWNFGADHLATGVEWNANMDFKNFWDIYTGGSVRMNSLDQNILRGGTLMKIPGNWNFRFGFSTDSRKKFIFEANMNMSEGFENSSDNFGSNVEFSYKPLNYLVISFNPGYSKSFSELQYVTTIDLTPTDKYIFANIDRQTISSSFRVNLNMSPNLSLQYWGQPFIASGKFYDHKLVVNPMATNYSDRFHTFSQSQISLDGDQYLVDENGDRSTDYRFDQEDFNFKEFLSNMVLRWEYSPGSSVFLVWSQSRSSSNSSGNLDLFDDLGDLFNGGNNKPHNVFLIKFSYRFGIK